MTSLHKMQLEFTFENAFFASRCRTLLSDFLVSPFYILYFRDFITSLKYMTWYRSHFLFCYKNIKNKTLFACYQRKKNIKESWFVAAKHNAQYAQLYLAYQFYKLQSRKNIAPVLKLCFVTCPFFSTFRDPPLNGGTIHQEN